jgi:hypothetical protein
MREEQKMLHRMRSLLVATIMGVIIGILLSGFLPSLETTAAHPSSQEPGYIHALYLGGTTGDNGRAEVPHNLRTTGSCSGRYAIVGMTAAIQYTNEAWYVATMQTPVSDPNFRAFYAWGDTHVFAQISGGENASEWANRPVRFVVFYVDAIC